MKHWRHRSPKRLNAAVVALALVVTTGALFYAAIKPGPTNRVEVDSHLEVQGTDVCTRTIYSDGSSTLECPPPPTVSPSGSPTTAPPTSSPAPTPTTPSPTPTTPSPTPTTPSPTPTSPSPSPTPSPTPTGCPVAGKNVPGAADPWGGCWPGPGNTGVPSGTVLTAYSGPCTITAANTVIDHQLVTCSTLDIRATGVVIAMSMLQGTDVNDDATAGASFTIADSTVVNGARDQCMCVGTHDFTAVRINVTGGNRSMLCMNHCTVTDSWVHGQQLTGAQHASGIRERQNGVFTHNSVACDWLTPNDDTSLGCSGDFVGYSNPTSFGPVQHNTVSRNLLVSTTRTVVPNPPGPGTTVGFCLFGGNTGGGAQDGLFQVFTENVFQRGLTGKCGDFGPVTDVNTSKQGAVWSGNTWDTGETVPAG